MFLLNKSPNPLLTKITRFLQENTNETSQDFTNIIKTTTADDLIPSFIFLNRWISENISVQKDEKKIQVLTNLIGQISLKLPTVILLTGFFESNMQASKLHWLMKDFYSPLHHRVIRLRSYMKPFSLYNLLPSSFQTFPQESQIIFPVNDNRNKFFESCYYQNFYIELESDPSYRSAILLYFKRLLLNHAPISLFKPLLCQRSSRSILTKAITEILEELNRTREAEQEELIFSFSTIFLYVHAFAISNEIDSQSLCEYLQTRPFISPFLALSLVNQIPQNIYLYNLLAPRELSGHLDHQSEMKFSQYVIVNLSKSGRLDEFVPKVATILSNYFLSSNVSPASAEMCSKLDDVDFLSFVQLSSSNLYKKMKVVLTITRERSLGATQVSYMGIHLLKCIIFSILRTYLDCVDTSMFTPTFCEFIRAILSFIVVGFPESLGFKLFDIESFKNDTRMIEFLLRSVLKCFMVVCINMQANEHFIKFCFAASKIDLCRESAYACLRRMARCGRLFVAPSIIKELETTNDIFILFEYASALSKMTSVRSFRELNALVEFRNKLTRRIGVTVAIVERETFVIDKIDGSVFFRKSEGFSEKEIELNNLVISMVENLSPENAVEDLVRVINSNPDNLISILAVFSMTKFFQIRDFAAKITSKFNEFLAYNQYSPGGVNKFEIRMADYAFPIALDLIGRLLTFSFDDFAFELLSSIKILLAEDQSPLHFISLFLIKYRYLMRPDMLSIFSEVVSNLPLADKFFVNVSTQISEEEKYELIKKITYNLIDNDMVLVRHPDILNHEYNSLFTHVTVFSQLSLILSPLRYDDIANLLYMPISDLSHIWMKRKSACLVLAKLSSLMSSEIGLKYFNLIMEMKNPNISSLCGRLFLIESRFDVYRTICFDCRTFLKTPEKLDFFMKMLMPSFFRLVEGPEAATALLTAFLECVGVGKAKREVVDEVMDAIALFFTKIDMSAEVGKILMTVEKFAPHLKDDVLTCIEAAKSAGNYWNS